MFRAAGLLAVIPATVLLTISFFVLLSLRKVDSHGLKVFGYVITALLWCCTLLAFSLGVYTLYTGRCMMEEMKRCKMQGMMMGGEMPKMMHGQK